jgi:hypothetical protein
MREQRDETEYSRSVDDMPMQFFCLTHSQASWPDFVWVVIHGCASSIGLPSQIVRNPHVGVNRFEISL